mmetsp:Transcript_16898/g.21903  ORF Transcript_16898/g.21903 Transcript_16898/m.21903 type:complete len:310 (-) Transcript_16898:334-1263(-)|eukprot:CAMPEP_0197287352 /NCGR_PEP_ID=MMETSP0890-20130614/3646_1 /TAXON_ID=44058 ORGANISM="Aureoumbra lagunensis, Strain CCMP1510" /NCGR_SAMPLE_ID=MMETSP0890 /ASSEMBLY_ACC=CAM_ASM_000533 /LENGTH=309 /DNA_ID=CAMNT_0042756911 /DNA_START=89 /DNA_END=1018 /DNA_ORIENTATION=-
MKTLFFSLCICQVVISETTVLTKLSTAQLQKLKKNIAIRGGGAAAGPISPGLRPGPAGVYDNAMSTGATKAALSSSKLVTLSFLSGAHIALGAFLMVSCGGSVPGIKEANPGLARALSGVLGLPMGLLMVLGGGGELATGNFALISASYANGKTTFSNLVRNWSLVYLGNFIGSVVVAAFAAIANTGVSNGAIAIATGKMAAPFAATFCKGILCNWLVSMAVYMSLSHKDLASKAAAVFFPISGFVALGLEHSIANMFLIPFAIFLGAKISLSDFLIKNLLPVTLGNIIGGGLFVGLFYYNVYGTNKVN